MSRSSKDRYNLKLCEKTLKHIIHKKLKTREAKADDGEWAWIFDCWIYPIQIQPEFCTKTKNNFGQATEELEYIQNWNMSNPEYPKLIVIGTNKGRKQFSKLPSNPNTPTPHPDSVAYYF